MLFLGAGASAPAAVPLTRGFVTSLRDELLQHPRGGGALLQNFDRLVTFLTCYLRERERNSNPGVAEHVLAELGPDIEMVYEALVRLSDPDEDPLLAGPGRKRRVIPTDAARALRAMTERHIRERAYLAPDTMQYLDELIRLRTAGRVTVFSTNYDTGIEALCERHDLRWEDGFRVRWDPSVFDDQGIDFSLHKLHGSVLWYRDGWGGYFRSPLRPKGDGQQRLSWFGGDCDPLLVYPARKSALDAPYAHGIGQLASRLGNRETATTLLVIGYSFRDSHLRQIVFDAARSNALLTVVLIDPAARAIYESQLARYGDGQSPLWGRVLCVNEALDSDGSVLYSVMNRRANAFQIAWAGEREFRRTRSRSDYAARDIANQYARAGDSDGFDRLIAMQRALSSSIGVRDRVLSAFTSVRLALQALCPGSEVRDRAEALGALLHELLGEPVEPITVGDRDAWAVAFHNPADPAAVQRGTEEALEDAEWWSGDENGRVRRRLDAFVAWVRELPATASRGRREQRIWRLEASDLITLGVLPSDWTERTGRGLPDEFVEDVGAGLIRVLHRDPAARLVRLVVAADSFAPGTAGATDVVT